MNSLYRYFFKQYINAWKDLSLRIRIEIIILFVVYFSFFTTRLIQLFNSWLSEPNITAFGLQQFLLHVLLIFITFSITFIHINLIPKQKGLVYYRTLPLNSLNTFWLVFFLHFKYQLIGLIFIVPVFAALLAVTSIFYALYFLIAILIYQTICILFMNFLTIRIKAILKNIFTYLIVLIFAFSFYTLLYFYTNYFAIFDPVLTLISLVILVHYWKSDFMQWDRYIKNKTDKTTRSGKKNRIISYERFAKFPLKKLTPLLAKEWLNYIRNPKYVRFLFFSFTIYLLLLIVFWAKAEENFLIYSSILTMLFIWQHFSLQFNEKYIQAESAVLIKTFPLKYYQLWLAKFTSEFVFVFIILIFLSVFWLANGFVIPDIYQMLVALFLFALIVLAAIINFKLIFYDRPRFAGYAYHLFIIFILVMSANYYLVGPLIALMLLIYFTIYSYREFAK